MCFLFVRIFRYFMTGTDKTIFQYAAFSNDRFIANDTVFDDNSETRGDQYFITSNGMPLIFEIKTSLPFFHHNAIHQNTVRYPCFHIHCSIRSENAIL